MRWFVVACALVVSGCSTLAQREFSSLQTNWKQSTQITQDCRLSNYNKPEFLQLREKFNINPQRFTIQQTSNSEIPNKQQLAIFSSFYSGMQNCRADFLDRVRNFDQPASEIIQSSSLSYDRIATEFLKGRTSWGEYLTKVKDQSAKADENINEVENIRKEELEFRHEAELERRQEAARFMIEHQPPPPPPLVIQPWQPARQVNCNSMINGDFVNTTCN